MIPAQGSPWFQASHHHTKGDCASDSTLNWKQAFVALEQSSHTNNINNHMWWTGWNLKHKTWNQGSNFHCFWWTLVDCHHLCCIVLASLLGPGSGWGPEHGECQKETCKSGKHKTTKIFAESPTPGGFRRWTHKVPCALLLNHTACARTGQTASPPSPYCKQINPKLKKVL